MKKIILVRHGRAEDQTSGISDFERSLTVKGKVISGLMGRKLKEKEDNPGQFITSPAFRALETALIFAAEMEIPAEKIRMETSLYQADFNIFLNLVKNLDQETETITVFGHNPAFTEIADKLAAEGCEFMTKTSVICISFRTKTWTGVKPKSGKTEYFLKPDKSL